MSEAPDVQGSLDRYRAVGSAWRSKASSHSRLRSRDAGSPTKPPCTGSACRQARTSHSSRAPSVGSARSSRSASARRTPSSFTEEDESELAYRAQVAVRGADRADCERSACSTATARRSTTRPSGRRPRRGPRAPRGDRARAAPSSRSASCCSPRSAALLDAGGFGRHTFLCGQSGSGKTYSLGVVLERLLLETDLRIVVSTQLRLRAARRAAPRMPTARHRALRGGRHEVRARAGAASRCRSPSSTRRRRRPPSDLDPIGDRRVRRAALAHWRARGPDPDQLEQLDGGAGGT